MKKVCVAGVQMDIQFQAFESNLARIQLKIREAAEHAAQLIVFPECTLTGYCYATIGDALDHAIEVESTRLRPLFSSCKEHKVHIVVGFLERDGNRVHNSLLCIGPEGIAGHYRKIHLPYLGVDRFTTPGNKLEVVKAGTLNIGMNICYDCSFPESSRVLMLHGADVITLPTNWPPTSGRTADFIPNARALENHVYFMSINRIGEENGFSFIGKSKIVDPFGNDLAFADHAEETILYAIIDPKVARNKHLVNIPGEHEVDRLRDRRPEAYGTIVKSIADCQS